MMRISNITKYTAVAAIIFGSVFAFMPSANAFVGDQILSNVNDPNGIVCGSLSRVGLGCWSWSSSSGSTASNDTSTVSASTNKATSNSNLGASIYTGVIKKTYNDNQIMLVKTSNSSQVYEITGGQKHLIPTNEIFADYGFKPEMVQTISAAQLARYNRTKLVKVNGDNKHIYYLTEGFMVRLVPDNKVLDSYGDDINSAVTISKMEFNYYPVNQYVFLENPLNRDVFQVINGVKKYLTPMAVARMGLRDDQIAPVNQFELNFYKTGAPIVY